MRRRLRKKRRLGEFRELGFAVVARLARDAADLEEETWDFVARCVEPASLGFGGGWSERRMSGFVTRHRGSASEADRALVERWLHTRAWVEAVATGPLVDAWHGSDRDRDAEARSLERAIAGGTS